METSFQDQKMLFPNSEFAVESRKEDGIYKSVFLGNAIDINGNNSDLFLITYSSGRINVAVQFGQDEQNYYSGTASFWNDVVEKSDSAFHTLYRRAVEIGEMIEKEVVIGYSETKADLEDEVFYNSDYFKNRPSSVEFLEELSKMNLSDDEIIDKKHKFENQQLDYDNQYKSTHGDIPNYLNRANLYQVFKDIEEAQKLCDSDDGVFKTVRYVTEEHLHAIAKFENFIGTVIDKKLSK